MDSVIDELYNDLTICRLCSEEVFKGKTLKCHHSFCQCCLEEYTKDTTLGDMVPCPTCQARFTVNSRDFAELPSSVYLERIKQYRQTAAASGRWSELVNGKGGPLWMCDACGIGLRDSDRVATVKLYCTECRQKLCSGCAKVHHQLTVSKLHQVLPSTSRETDAERPATATSVFTAALSTTASPSTSVIRSNHGSCDRARRRGSPSPNRVNARNAGICCGGGASASAAHTLSGASNIVSLQPCVHHPNETATLFCNRCQLPICARYCECRHKGHDYRTLTSAGNDSTSSTACTAQAIGGGDRCEHGPACHTEVPQLLVDTVSEYWQAIEKARATREAFVDAITAREHEITLHADEFRRLIDAYQAKLYEELNAIKDRHLKDTNAVLNETDHCLQIVDGIRPYVSALQKASAYQESTRVLCGDLRQHLKTDEIEAHVKALSTVRVRYNATPQPVRTLTQVIGLDGDPDLNNILGTIVTHNKYAEDDNVGVVNRCRQKYLCESARLQAAFLDPPKMVTTMSAQDGSGTSYGEKPVSGLAVLKNRIYVCRTNCMELGVFDAETYKLERNVHIRGLQEPVDLGACPSHGSLYVCGRSECRVFRLTPDQEGSLNIFSWSTHDKPFRLDVSASAASADCGSLSGSVGAAINSMGFEPSIGGARVMVVFRETARIREYNHRGKLLRTIHLHTEALRSPTSAVPLTTDTIALCHGERGDLHHRVCTVRANGGTVGRSYGDTPGNAQTLFNVPVKLVKDPRGGLLVVDNLNNRILQLDDRMRRVRHILQYAHGIRQPLRLCLDLPNDRMLIGQHDGRILVFRI